MRGMSANVLGLSLLAALCAGCVSDTRLQSSSAGKSASYSPGSPDFDFEAAESVRDGLPGVDLYCRIPWTSLVFVRDSTGYEARYELRARFLPDAESMSVVERSREGFVRKGTEREDLEELLSMRVPLPEGKYVAEVTVEDRQSDATAVRRQGIAVFADSCARILRIVLVRDRGGRTEPFLPLHIPAGRDSLRAVITLTHPAQAIGESLEVRVLRYPTDSLSALPPYYLTPTAWSVRRTAVDFRKTDTVAFRIVPVEAGAEQAVSMPLVGLKPGFHDVVARCTTRACGSNNEVHILERSRGLVIVDRFFPYVRTRRGMVEPLQYLATEKEYREISEAPNEEELRKLFERFWLKLGETPERAANLIRQYYTRVEEANLQFSSYKEGWKTDRGMIHIIFGTPSMVEHRYRQEVWSFSTGYIFLFELVNPARFDEPVENWALVRDGYYEQAWVKEVDRWRRGQAF